MPSQPALVVVTGPPASGKTSVATAIARELALPVVSKDALKEALYDTLGAGDPVEDALDAAAVALLFRVVAMQLDAGISVMAESNFDTHTDPGPFRRLSDEHGALIVQVHLHGETDGLVEAFAARAASGGRHPGHGDEPSDAGELRAKIDAGVWDPLDLPGQLVAASTDEDTASIVARVRDVLGR